MDSPYLGWEKIDICVFNPQNYNIDRAVIRLNIPETFEYKFNNDRNSIFYYKPMTNTLTVENFGDFKRNTQCDWFDIRPRLDSGSGKYAIGLFYEIDYSTKLFSSFNPINTQVNSSVGTIGSAGYPNSSQYIKKNIIMRNDTISVFLKKTEKSGFVIIQENSWVIAIGGLISSVILIIFGPGSKKRIEIIKTKFKR